MTPQEQEAKRQKDRRAFVDKHKHELAGLILDGTVQRTGGEYAFWCRGVIIRVDQKLGQIFDDMFPEVPRPMTEGEKKAIAEAAKATNKPPK